MVRLVVVLAALLSISYSNRAIAVDGVIEINHARALAGGVTSGDSPGYPVTINGLVGGGGGSYRLTGPLLAISSGNVIDIAVDNVTLDLGGFEVACNVCPPAADGIAAPGRSNVVVLNGTVRNMPGDGLVVGERGRVENMRVIQNSGNGILTGDFSTVTDNTVSSNGGTGIFAGHANTVSGNIADHNSISGIVCFICTVTGNTVDSNGYHGITGQGGGGALIGNTMTSNGHCGLHFPGTAGGYGQNFVAYNNGGAANRQAFGGTPMGPNVCSNGADCTAGSTNNCP